MTSAARTAAQRYLEIDALRTLAIAMMIVYHTGYDLQKFFGWNIDVFSGNWLLLRTATASLFLLLVGISAVVMHERMQRVNQPSAHRFLKRGIIVLGIAMLLTIGSLIIAPPVYIRFGILHLIGVSLLLLPLFLPLAWGNIFLGAALIFAGSRASGVIADTSLLLPLGFMPQGFATLDYYPLLPWFGVVLIGSGIGHLLYVHRWIPAALRSLMDTLAEIRFAQWLVSPGRYSLFLYLVHQPLILALLAVARITLRW